MKSPEVGEIVLYHPFTGGGTIIKTLAAIIAAVRSQDRVNLTVFTETGGYFGINGVLFSEPRNAPWPRESFAHYKTAEKIPERIPADQPNQSVNHIVFSGGELLALKRIVGAHAPSSKDVWALYEKLLRLTANQANVKQDTGVWSPKITAQEYGATLYSLPVFCKECDKAPCEWWPKFTTDYKLGK